MEDLIIPEGYMLVKTPELLEEEQKAKKKAELQKLIAETPEPSIEELAEFGKMYHPYYEKIRLLNNL